MGGSTPRLPERLAWALLAALRAVPPRCALWAGGLLGDAVGRLPLREVRRARAHLARAYPEQPPSWHATMARRCFRHFGRMLLWSLATATRDARELRRGVAVEGAEHWRALARACRRGEGTLGLAGHFGNWELLARVAATLIPLTVVGRRLRWPLIDRLVWRVRTAGSAQLIHQDDDVRLAIRALRSGRYVATLPDQDIPRLQGVHVPWFGIPAYTPLGPAILALTGGGWVQPGHCYLVPLQGLRWRWVAHCGPRVCFAGSDRHETARRILAWAMAYEEQLVRRRPEQWVWWHLRWRTPPPPAP